LRYDLFFKSIINSNKRSKKILINNFEIIISIEIKLPIIAIGSGWDKVVLSAVEGFSEPAFGFAARLWRILLQNPKS